MVRPRRHYPVVFFALLAGFAAAGRAAEVPLIPRAALFSNPDKEQAGISPDGTRVSFLAPVDGVMNIWVAPFGHIQDAKPATHGKTQDITNYFWSFNNKHILYFQDNNGDEDDHLYRLDPATGEVKDLTPIPGVKAELVESSYKKPDELLIGLNDRDPKYHDVYRLTISTGERRRILKNTKYLGFIADTDLALRRGETLDGQDDITEKPPKIEGRQEDARKWGSVVDPSLPAFDASNRYVTTFAHGKNDKRSLVQIDLQKDDDETVIAAGEESDIDGVLLHPTKKTVQAFWEDYTQQAWKVVDPDLLEDFNFLSKLAHGAFYIVDRTLDDKVWIVDYALDNAPVKTYSYERGVKKWKPLFSTRSALEHAPLADRHPVVITSRDGLPMVSYLTLPVGSDTDGDMHPKTPLPMVLWVHGGPNDRDDWGWDAEHQWMANRGYAVLSVNYRGSAGFGRAFEDAGDKEWGGKMQDDLNDAVDWAVQQGIADPKRVAIAGISYGGYAALAGLTFTPDKFACAVDVCGPTNLVDLLKKDVKAYMIPGMPMEKDLVGDPNSKKGRAFLYAHSPVTKAGDVKRPLLIGQGQNDPRVFRAESDQFVAAMKDTKTPLTYIVYPDEGHGFQRPQNNISFYAVMEQFLAKYLGGRAEPIGNDLKDSTIQVVQGADQVPGLTDGLAARGTAKPVS